MADFGYTEFDQARLSNVIQAQNYLVDCERMAEFAARALMGVTCCSLVALSLSLRDINPSKLRFPGNLVLPLPPKISNKVH